MIDPSIDEHYERIKGDLVSRGLTDDRLIDDLLDHVCCMVEENMEGGADFESSYARVLDSIGENGFARIQHQTMLNLDKKYQRMKNFTYVFGLTSALLTIVGSIFKSLHWQGASILLTVGIVMIVFVFLPLYFIAGHKEQPDKKNPAYPIVGYITLALLLLGALFKIMHWPGAGVIIISSAGFLIIGFMPLYVINAFHRSGKGKVNLPYIIMLLVGVALVMVYSNIRMTREGIDVYLEESVTNEATVASVQERSAQLMEMVRDSADGDKLASIMMIHEQARALQVMISEMQEGMLSYVEQPGASITDVEEKDNRWAGREAILEHDNGRKFALEAKKFRELLLELVRDPVNRGQIEDHMEFTGSVFALEYAAKDVGNGPLVKNYYKLTDASKGIVLSEYVAIAALMHP